MVFLFPGERGSHVEGSSWPSVPRHNFSVGRHPTAQVGDGSGMVGSLLDARSEVKAGAGKSLKMWLKMSDLSGGKALLREGEAPGDDGSGGWGMEGRGCDR